MMNLRATTVLYKNCNYCSHRDQFWCKLHSTTIPLPLEKNTCGNYTKDKRSPFPINCNMCRYLENGKCEQPTTTRYTESPVVEAGCKYWESKPEHSCSNCYYRSGHQCYRDNIKPEFKIESMEGSCNRWEIRSDRIVIEKEVDSNEPINRTLLEETKSLLEEIE